MSRNTLVTALLIGVAGCGGSSGSTNNNNMPTPDDLSVAGPDMAAYDPGPYPGSAATWGVDEGDIVYPLKAKGYLLSPEHTDANDLTYEEIKIEIIRQNPQCKCLMLSEAATWCGPCNAEQPELVEAIEKDPSFCVFNVLVDGPVPGKAPTAQEVLDWNVRHNQNFPIVGSNISTRSHLPRPDALPTNVVINPKTMKILAINTGLGPNTISDAKEMCAADQ